MSLETQVDGSSKAIIALFNGVQTSVDGCDDGNRAPRLPRWTRHEILVLIQGKKVAENRVRRGRAVGSAFGSNPLEPKWASVSSYCKRHGVNRGPVQCRKRWSNLAGDYKRIKEWESSQVKGDASDSFWVMRNDLRREKKLPGFFDREVYDILEGRGGGGDDDTETMRVVKDTGDVKMDDDGGVVSVAAAAEEEEEAIFDSGRITPADDGLFSDFEKSGQEETGGIPEKETVVMESLAKTISSPIPISENRCENICRGRSDQANNDLGATNEKRQAAANSEKPSMSSREGWKRRRSSSDEGGETSAQDQLVKVLERNGRMLTAQLESQNINCQLDRDQRKDHTSSLVAVLSKLADAIGKIADKL